MNQIAPLISAESATAITPSDSLTFQPTRAIYLGSGGDVKVDMANGDTVVFYAMAGGVIHAINCTRIYATDTSASNILALR